MSYAASTPGEVPSCAPLPSAAAACDFVARPTAAGLLALAGTTLGRALLVGAGLWAVGSRENVVRNALAGAAAIEGFVIAWSVLGRKGQAS